MYVLGILELVFWTYPNRYLLMDLTSMKADYYLKDLLIWSKLSSYIAVKNFNPISYDLDGWVFLPIEMNIECVRTDNWVAPALP